MANRMFHQLSYGLEPKPVSLWAVVSIGATGAPTVTRAKGITSIARVSAGLYTVTLQDNYLTLLGFDVTVQSATGIPDVAAGLKTNSVTAGSLQFQCAAPTNSTTTTLIAADPANGDTLFIQLNLNDSGAL